MRFEYLVLLIVAFNVVTALARRRAKARQAPRTTTRSTAPGGEGARPASSGSSAPGGEEEGPTEMPSLGRDVLDQIARDLGLKAPPRPAPQPVPKQASRPVSRPVPVPETARPEAAPRGRAARSSRALEPAAVASPIPADPTVFRRSATLPELLPARNAANAVPRSRLNPRDPARLREAMVWKEILDGPVSRRPPSAPGRRIPPA